jgi:diaminopimelate epimerase
VRGLAAILARDLGLGTGGEPIVVHADSGRKVLSLLGREGDQRFLFRANMGRVEDLRSVTLDVAGERTQATRLWMGNPQCVILAELDEARLHRLGPALQQHPAFPEGVNVEIAQAEGDRLVRILIWERGVGPTRSSGTGSCAAAVAAAHAGLTGRDVEVVAPGGSQRVEWHDDGVWLTGWAEILLDGHWLR